EGGVADVATLDQGSLQLRACDGGQGPARSGFVRCFFDRKGRQNGGVERSSAHGTSLKRDPLWGSALAVSVPDRPGRHPGHPTANGGLPASKPGFSAGTRDL